MLTPPLHISQNFEPQVTKFNRDSKYDITLQMDYTNDRLDIKTAKYAAGYDAVCLFVNDTANSDVLYVMVVAPYKFTQTYLAKSTQTSRLRNIVQVFPYLHHGRY